MIKFMEHQQLKIIEEYNNEKTNNSHLSSSGFHINRM